MSWYIYTSVIRDVASPFIESWGSGSGTKSDDDSDDNSLSLYQLAPKEAKSFLASVMSLGQRSYQRVKRQREWNRGGRERDHGSRGGNREDRQRDHGGREPNRDDRERDHGIREWDRERHVRDHIHRARNREGRERDHIGHRDGHGQDHGNRERTRESGERNRENGERSAEAAALPRWLNACMRHLAVAKITGSCIMLNQSSLVAPQFAIKAIPVRKARVELGVEWLGVKVLSIIRIFSVFVGFLCPAPA